MSLACQNNSYLKTLTTRVKSCKPGELTDIIDGKKNTISGFEVILDDTVLFPMGGGQPDDRGTVNGIEVVAVRRYGADVVHYLSSPVDVDSEVVVDVDWSRRWDHMQQHSGQHLITAVTAAEYGYQTTSWCLSDKTSFIELDTAAMTTEQLCNVERIVNEKIRNALPVYPTVYTGKDDPQLLNVRTRGLPEDHVGCVRVVTIEGIETNMCCGTHVSSLSHLQAVKLLSVDKGKKGKVNLVFLVGDRLLKYLGSCFEREKTFTQMLKGGPDDHVDLLQKLQNSYRIAQKNSTVLLRECAKFEAAMFKASEHRPPLFIGHRKEGDMDYMNMIVSEIGDQNVLVFVTAGEDVGAGLFLLAGRDEQVTVLGPKVASILDGKGAGKNGRYQGKVNKIQKRADVEKMLKEYFSNQQQLP